MDTERLGKVAKPLCNLRQCMLGCISNVFGEWLLSFNALREMDQGIP